MNLTELTAEVREENPDVELEKFAELVLEAVFESDNSAELLYPAVLAFVTTAERNRVRSVERRAAPFRQPSSKPETSGVELVEHQADDEPEDLGYIKPGSDEDPAIAARRELMAERCYVPTRGYVPWGDLTVEDHTMIVEFLRKRISGYETTIQKHAEAIDVLTESGAQTLNDFYAYRGYTLAA